MKRPTTKMIAAAERHDTIAARIVMGIIKPMAEVGAKNADVMVVLESVISGVFLAMSNGHPESDAVLIEALFEGVTERLAAIRAEIRSNAN